MSDDGELLRRFQADNDQAAFETLVERHGGLVYNVCSRILSDRQAAEDATQAVFLALARKAASLQQRATVAPWLYQVAWHVTLRARSASQARTRLEQEAARMKPQATPDGKLLAGTDAVVNVETGAVVHRLGAAGSALVGVSAYPTPATSQFVRALSPSHTQMAEVSKGKLVVIDVRTGLSVWQCRIEPRYTEAPRAVFWNASETQMAISPSTSAGVVQIELFANTLADKNLDVSDAAKLRSALAASDTDARQGAVQSCVEQSAKSLPVLEQFVTAAPAGKARSDAEVLAQRMAILALERIAREQGKVAEIRAFLTSTAAAQPEDTAELCRDALVRLKAAERADVLHANVQKAAPLTWPETAPAAPRGDF